MNHHLTKREREAVTLRARGHSIRRIAIDMGISSARANQILHQAKRRLEHARAFSRERDFERDFRALYQREAALRNLRLIANAFYHLSHILP